MNRDESRAKYDKLVGDLMSAVLGRKPAMAPAFRYELQEDMYDLIEAYLLDLEHDELQHLAVGLMPYEGWEREPRRNILDYFLEQNGRLKIPSLGITIHRDPRP